MDRFEFTCPLCGKKIEREIKDILKHQDEHVVDKIKQKHPDWSESDGLCQKCYDYYKKQIHPQG